MIFYKYYKYKKAYDRIKHTWLLTTLFKIYLKGFMYHELDANKLI